MIPKFRSSLFLAALVGASLALSGIGTVAQAKTVGYGGKKDESSSTEFWRKDKDRISDFWKPKDEKNHKDYTDCKPGKNDRFVRVSAFRDNCKDGRDYHPVKDEKDCDPVAPVPLPAAGWLLMGSMGALAALRRRKRV
jgi:hypothetical protein